MRRSHRRHYRRLGDADMTDSGPLRITPGQRFSLEAEAPAAKKDSDFGPSEPPPQRLPAKADTGPKEKILPFMTPKVGNTMVGIGMLSIIGGVGYYIWKGGDIANLWDLIKPSFGKDEPFFSRKPLKTAEGFKTRPATVVSRRAPGYQAPTPDRY